jgi:hypothetical protein
MGARSKKPDEVLGIGAGPGGKYGYIIHLLSFINPNEVKKCGKKG